MPEENDDIKVKRHNNGASVQLWGSYFVLGRNDAFDLLAKLQAALTGDSVSEVKGPGDEPR